MVLYAEEEKVFNGLYLNLGNLFRLSHAKSLSISPENFTGEKGKGGMSIDGLAKKAARDLGQGWKVSPYVIIKPKETFVMAEIQGPGAIQQIWMTPAGNWRFSILRFLLGRGKRNLRWKSLWGISSPAAGENSHRSLPFLCA